MNSDISLIRISSLLLVVAGSTIEPAGADSLLFPVLVSNAPNVTTIASVVDGPTAGGGATHLTYIYRYKDAFDSSGVANRNGNCSTRTLTRSSISGDVVSFDVAGAFEGGNALFGDANFYGGGFGLGVTGPQRGYLLVTNTNSTGSPLAVGDNLDLSGEFVVMEIAGGAAWGGKAINDVNRENFDFINANIAGGGVYSALPSNGTPYRRFTFAPPSEWSTRFFVTPIGANMDSAQLTAPVSVADLYDRDGQSRPFTSIVLSVTCTAAVDLRDLVDSSTWAAVENTGGWASFGANDAVIYKLEYSSDPQYNGTVNNGFLLSDSALP
ncbi:hypothetical protein HW932_00745 [Allochromatium humboldtianum]|uniref:Uncharacterized protein n=1 Tax=Allochromatium humboldtianum TaxID=504901 RepID=A0A850R4P9_9GAMM|nr:hypothetical protein [Allochromatium humboldtianum]NVZ07785.1 hypothetical protein [Allochromatium humboldtianum]